jgi:chromosome segregation ATPase
MNEDYSELVEYLDKKFNKIDERFAGIDERFADIDKHFVSNDKHFITLDQRLISVEAKIDDLQENKADKKDVSNLLDAVDAYSAKSDKYFQEMIMASRKSDRHEQWIHQIADKVGVKLGY